MKLFQDPQLDHLQQELRRAYDLHQEGSHVEATASYRRVHEALRRAGKVSGFVLWNLAVVADNAGEVERAFDWIVQALETDPLAVPFRNSFDVITRRLREAIAAPGRAADDPSTPRLHALLVRTGEADVPAHAAMVRWCAATGDLPRALALADALTLLHPAAREAWLCKAEVALRAGDAALHAACTAEAAALEGDPVPFAVPGVARG
jgi:tetratricopeptide (TPR) repeat protein